jgi:hypothetical protein
MTTYPVGYGTERVSMSGLQTIFGPNMHPEFARRLWAWLESEQGRIGIGSGYRSTALQARLFASNPRRFARPGSSFHESHTWGGTVTGYAAVDLVAASLPPRAHRSPTWAEGDSAKKYGLHAFIRRNEPRGEPWHLQFVETRSASAWKSAGSPNVTAWQLPDRLSWYMYGSGGTYLAESNGTLRTAQSGALGAYGVYFRMGSDQFFTPPYTFSGKMLVHGRMTPPVFPDGTPCPYDPGIVFHVMHDMADSPWSGNEENIVMGFASSRTEAFHNVEIGGPGAPYGPRTGWESRRRAADINPVDGAWHDFRCEVYSHAHYALFWDDVELLDVVEKEPVSMRGPVGVGLRLDFFDVEMKDLAVRTATPSTGGTVINVTVPTIRLGDQGGWVRKLQALLTTFNQDIPCDGDFGPLTDTSVKAVQAFLGLTVDGVCGPQTWGVLMQLAPDA